jgi:hypothetical protein
MIRDVVNDVAFRVCEEIPQQLCRGWLICVITAIVAHTLSLLFAAWL